jgi:hypothetical protein
MGDISTSARLLPLAQRTPHRVTPERIGGLYEPDDDAESTMYAVLDALREAH